MSDQMSTTLKRIGASNRLTLDVAGRPLLDLRGWPAFWWTATACALAIVAVWFIS